jgi:hypothetical protein
LSSNLVPKFTPQSGELINKAPLAAAVSTPEKVNKSKAVEGDPALLSPPPVSTAEKVKQLKAKPAESALAVVPPPPPPPPPAEKAQVADNKKEAPADQSFCKKRGKCHH